MRSAHDTTWPSRVAGGGSAPRVIADAVEGLGAEVQGREGDVGTPDGMVEALVEEGRQGLLAGVAAGAVTAVVAERDGLGQGHVEPVGAGDAGGDLGDLEGVGEAGAQVIGGKDEDLRLAGQAAKGGGVEDPIAIALETGAVGVGRLRGSSRSPAPHERVAPRRQRAAFDLLTLRAATSAVTCGFSLALSRSRINGRMADIVGTRCDSERVTTEWEKSPTRRARFGGGSDTLRAKNGPQPFKVDRRKRRKHDGPTLLRDWGGRQRRAVRAGDGEIQRGRNMTQRSGVTDTSSCGRPRRGDGRGRPRDASAGLPAVRHARIRTPLPQPPHAEQRHSGRGSRRVDRRKPARR